MRAMDVVGIVVLVGALALGGYFLLNKKKAAKQMAPPQGAQTPQVPATPVAPPNAPPQPTPQTPKPTTEWDFGISVAKGTTDVLLGAIKQWG